MVPLGAVALVGYGGVLRARAEGRRVRREAKFARVSFIVAVLRVCGIGEEGFVMGWVRQNEVARLLSRWVLVFLNCI